MPREETALRDWSPLMVRRSPQRKGELSSPPQFVGSVASRTCQRDRVAPSIGSASRVAPRASATVLVCKRGRADSGSRRFARLRVSFVWVVVVATCSCRPPCLFWWTMGWFHSGCGGPLSGPSTRASSGCWTQMTIPATFKSGAEKGGSGLARHGPRVCVALTNLEFRRGPSLPFLRAWTMMGPSRDRRPCAGSGGQIAWVASDGLHAL